MMFVFTRHECKRAKKNWEDLVEGSNKASDHLFKPTCRHMVETTHFEF